MIRLFDDELINMKFYGNVAYGKDDEKNFAGCSILYIFYYKEVFNTCTEYFLKTRQVF